LGESFGIQMMWENRKTRDLPPASLETPRHREENAMWRLFSPRKYRGQNKRHPSWRKTRGGGEVMCVVPSPPSLGITPERVAGISDAVLRILNARNILFFSVSPAKRVVNLFLNWDTQGMEG
jgi:hypothetical protein